LSKRAGFLDFLRTGVRTPDFSISGKDPLCRILLLYNIMVANNYRTGEVIQFLVLSTKKIYMA